RPDILAVDVTHEIGLSDAQLVVADVEEHATPVQDGAHGSVHHVDSAVGDEVAQGGHASARSSGWGRATAPSWGRPSPCAGRSPRPGRAPPCRRRNTETPGARSTSR